MIEKEGYLSMIINQCKHFSYRDKCFSNNCYIFNDENKIVLSYLSPADFSH